MRTIWFDMDGTIADLYSVENWEPKLRASDPSPYLDAKPLLHLSLLSRRLHEVQSKGYKIGILSWTSKDSTEEYELAVADAKIQWLRRHLPSVSWDRIRIIRYGAPKEERMDNTDDILFDDNEEIRNNWFGDAYPPGEIFITLAKLLK